MKNKIEINTEELVNILKNETDCPYCLLDVLRRFTLTKRDKFKVIKMLNKDGSKYFLDNDGIIHI